MYISGDKYRIGQVITNLITNAIKYAPQAKKVNVLLVNKRNGVTISVQDFGPGIDRSDQAKLFRQYFRAANTQSARGTGIGLFISSQIIAHHKGKIWVESKVGKGSIFSIWLPAKNKVLA
jgi:signal transduction histidine kinase